ncbi:DUF6794 domain-containing protein [Nodosilinea sp. E11]|uniref:DUF6794 domain-containing protein n=1 Tax=Nodosilinea sp. E11 TaxID=3037479 RepID=UPI00293488D2|nr:DUF6794 domain-containing protein [Nodosilinea sp. E11]WOD37138.1 DUF6794 domain-containing protein [Nodosilinea sp. E11]
MAEQLSKTLDEAVDFLLRELSDEDKATLKATPEDNLIDLHLSFGQWIRNRFKLWNENFDLVEALGCFEPDSASEEIINAAWTRLQGEE